MSKIAEAVKEAKNAEAKKREIPSKYLPSITFMREYEKLKLLMDLLIEQTEKMTEPEKPIVGWEALSSAFFDVSQKAPKHQDKVTEYYKSISEK